MGRSYIIFGLLFLLIWGIGVFISYIAGLERANEFQGQSDRSVTELLQQHQATAKDIEEQQQKLLEDHNFETRRYQDRMQMNPPAQPPTMPSFNH